MEQEPPRDRTEIAKEGMTRELMDVYGVSYAKARFHVEEMFEKIRQESEQEDE